MAHLMQTPGGTVPLEREIRDLMSRRKLGKGEAKVQLNVSTRHGVEVRYITKARFDAWVKDTGYFKRIPGNVEMNVMPGYKPCFSGSDGIVGLLKVKDFIEKGNRPAVEYFKNQLQLTDIASAFDASKEEMVVPLRPNKRRQHNAGAEQRLTLVT